MHPFGSFIFAVAIGLSSNTPAVVLRSGDVIPVSGGVREQDGRLVFRSATDGNLYSLPASEVNLEATASGDARAAHRPSGSPHAEIVITADTRGSLRLREEERLRLLKQLESNHSGKPPVDPPAYRQPVVPASSAVEVSGQDEWSWRSRARSYEEGERQATENLALLHERIERLRSEIRSFTSLGYREGQFTYQTSQLVLAVEQIPAAELEVRRAQRASAQFRDDARRQGVLPGWLR